MSKTVSTSSHQSLPLWQLLSGCADAVAAVRQGQSLTDALAALNAIKVAGGTDYDAIGKALKSSPVDTTVGKIKFDAKGDAEGVGFAVYQVKGGKFAEVK